MKAVMDECTHMANFSGEFYVYGYASHRLKHDTELLWKLN